MRSQVNGLEHIGVRDGLSQGMIFSILQDSDGFIWIATKHGLNRYDGKKIKLYQPVIGSKKSPGDLTITTLYEDSRNLMWVGTQINGLEIYDKRTDRFYALKDYLNSEISTALIQSLEEDKYRNIWVGASTGLFRIKMPPNNILEASFNLPDILEHIRIEKIQSTTSVVQSILFHKDSVYWGGAFGLNSRHINGPGISTYPHLSGQNIITEENNINKIFIDKHGAKWIFRPHTFSRVDCSSVNNFSLDLQRTLPAMGVFIDSDSSFYLLGYDLIHYTVDKSGIKSVERKAELSPYYGKFITIDRSGIIWMGTNGYGVYKYNPGKHLFRHHMEGKSLQHIFLDRNNNLYVWHNSRILMLDKLSGEELQAAHLPKNLLYSRNIYEDNKGDFWFHQPFHTQTVQLVRWSVSKGKVTALAYTQEPNILSFIFEDSAGRIWISTDDQHLLRLNEETAIFDPFRIPENLGQAGQNIIITSMAEDSEGRFWVGTSHGVFNFILDGNSMEFEDILVESGVRGKGLSKSYILDIHLDNSDSNTIWFATKGGGLNKYSKKNRKFEWIQTDEGLPDNVIYGILNYDDDLWLSTNKGLAVYNKINEDITIYTQEEGLQNNEFNTFSFFKGENNLLYFGGINGLNVIDPKVISSNKVRPKVVITEVVVNNRKFEFPAHKTIQNETDLPGFHHDENMFTFQFSALDFTAPGKNMYQYRLEGADKDWLSPTSTNEITYANLRPGNYTFRVRGSNNSRLWSENEASFSFIVRAPWWARYWAYILYFLLLSGGILGIYRFQVKRSELRRQLEYEIKEAERLQELDKVKSNFFSGITHEFKTPLTLIIEPLRQVIQEVDDLKIRAKLELAGRNSDRLLVLVNDLLDMSKMEGGKMNLVKSKINLTEFVADVVENFKSITDKRNIQLQGRLGESIFYMADHSKFELVMNNLLMNAVKYTPEGGQIEVDIELVQRGEDEEIVIKVRDNGIGIASEEKDRIFERFYQVDTVINNSGGGTGIGLALTKELIELMGGRIFLDERHTQGACFVVVLPGTEIVSGDNLTHEVNQETKGSSQDNLGRLGGVKDEVANGMKRTDLDTVLIIEDNEDLRILISDSLNPHFSIVTAVDGIEGIALAESLVPDLVLSDLMMPGKSGYEVCSAIKNTEITAHIPVILLTAKSAIDAKLSGLKIGADDYITKPFHSEELVLRITNQINSRKKIQNNYIAKLEFQNQKEIWESEKELTQSDRDFLERFTRIISEHLSDDEMSVDDFANKLLISRVQLHRKIKAVTGQNTTEFIRNYRLDKAVELIKSGTGNINEISMEVGIPNRNYFTRKFKERFGKPPSEF